jgi:hypothetical protein
MLRHRAVLGQGLLAVTQMLPDTAELLKFTVIEVVPCPDAMVAPVGTVHVYEVAPATAAIE